ncbi:hypothetical protein TgHK011_007607 [Trichoderma gracile]|nr:hypothetical protein TgHK011_007607 [Trichoderma gracile]
MFTSRCRDWARICGHLFEYVHTRTYKSTCTGTHYAFAWTDWATNQLGRTLQLARAHSIQVPKVPLCHEAVSRSGHTQVVEALHDLFVKFNTTTVRRNVAYDAARSVEHTTAALAAMPLNHAC